MWYIRVQMGSFRKSLPYVSLLLLALLVPVQAAGCCKWSALLGWSLPAEKRAVTAEDIPGGMSPDHACCRKQAQEGDSPASVPAPADCSTGEKGCCLEDAGATGPALASVPAASAAGPALPILLPAGESPRVAPLLPSRTSPETSGPPPYLSHLRLLI